ncbi:dihydroxyacetone kinase subunit DhaK [Sinorhizobium meliloti]|uniref:dihydroxyacetone kinase family protein n=1 Tax=Rhizobium meliloti TaxID=382 RepID=UPI000EFAB5A1|nr:dihydroxyacetone kinase family protein [Sinorhizobium meliloti]RMC64861.1 dihydroxyacetone kinase subunit DhaK [Sinorhizobium meliloti]RVO43544.1 dihydroxyacetone kinase subunit DhaK [Sinorhizobium meliloti]
MKKLINDPRTVVREMLEGLADMTPGLALLDTENVALRADVQEAGTRPVAVISGGGAGHEPAHAGYVGRGLLTAAVTGDVFTSPSVDAILAAIRASAGPAGALLIVKNYTGDRLNFGLAAELAAVEGIPVEIVVVADDVALSGIVAPERRRGIAGTVLIHKIAGAAAASGKSLKAVAEIARAAASRLGTMGVALGACTVPAAGRPGFELGEREIELGLGIHGEKGVERVGIRSADELSDHLIAMIAQDLGLKAGDRAALLVNGLGATPPMELAIIGRRALSALSGRGILVERAWMGNFLTALEMPGCSLSLLKVDDEDLALLDEEAEAPAWPGTGRIPKQRTVMRAPNPPTREPSGIIQAGSRAGQHRSIGLAVADALQAAEPYLTELDSKAGDGDLGASMVRGAEAIRALPLEAWASPDSALLAVANTLRRAIAGSSGPFYAVALSRAARHLAGREKVDLSDFSEAFAIGVGAVSEIGGAKPGDRTMLDALHPALVALKSASGPSARQVWAAAAEAAEAGAQSTAVMTPKLGRASYMGARAVGAPDGGAAAVAVWMKAVAGAI